MIDAQVRRHYDDLKQAVPGKVAAFMRLLFVCNLFVLLQLLSDFYFSYDFSLDDETARYFCINETLTDYRMPVALASVAIVLGYTSRYSADVGLCCLARCCCGCAACGRSCGFVDESDLAYLAADRARTDTGTSANDDMSWAWANRSGSGSSSSALVRGSWDESTLISLPRPLHLIEPKERVMAGPAVRASVADPRQLQQVLVAADQLRRTSSGHADAVSAVSPSSPRQPHPAPYLPPHLRPAAAPAEALIDMSSTPSYISSTRHYLDTDRDFQ
jgi:hypothetical protein